MSDNTEKKVLLTVSLEVKQLIADLAVTKKAIQDQKAAQKELDTTTLEGQKAYEVYGTQIRALTKISQDQQKEIINTIKANNAEKDSMDQLKANLSLLTAEYGKLSKEQRNSADGVALKNSIKGISDQLKDTEGGLGLFGRTVGEYKSNIMSALGLNNGFIDTIMKMKGGTKEAASTLAGEGVSALKSFGTQMLSLLANPIVAILAAIAVTVMMVSKAIDSNGDSTNKLNQIMAPFKVILEFVFNLFSQFVNILLSGVQAFEDMVLSIAKYIPGLNTIASKSQEAIALEKEKQALSAKARANLIKDSKDELDIAELKNKSRQKDKFSIQDRLKFLQEADALELGMAKRKTDYAKDQLAERIKAMALEGKAYKDLTSIEKDSYTQLIVNVNNAQKDYFQGTLRIKSQEAQLIQQDAAEKKAKEKEINDNHKQIMAQRLALAKEVQKAEIDLYTLQKNTIVETLKNTADDETKHYSIRYQAAVDYEKQSSDIIKKKADYEINSSDLIGKLREAQQKKDLVSAKMYQQLIVDQTKIIREQEKNDLLKIKNETNKTIDQIEKKQISDSIKNYEKQISEKNALLAQDAQDELSDLSKRYATGKISKAEYEKEKYDIVEEYHKKEFDSTLDQLNKELALGNLSIEQKTAIEKAIADTKKKYADKAAADEVKANEEAGNKIVEQEKKLVELKKQLYAELGTAIKSIGDGILDGQIQRYEQETTAVTTEQDAQKNAIDAKEKAGTISSAVATEEKAKIDADAKKKTDALDEKKKQATKEKAIFERAISIFNIGVNTAEAVSKIEVEAAVLAANPLTAAYAPVSLSMVPIVIGIGALQAAAVLAQPLPKAARGKVFKGNSHAQGGIPVEVEGDEMILTKGVYQDPVLRQIASIVNELGGGIPLTSKTSSSIFASPVFSSDGGYQNRMAQNYGSMTSEQMKQAMKEALKEMKAPIVTIEDIRKADVQYSKIEDRANY